MKVKFFNESEIKTCNEIKQQYKKLVFKHHPDKGGDTKDMQVINNEYEYLMKKYISCSNPKEHHDTSMEYPRIINELINMRCVKIELMGSWVWVSGSTYHYKDKLKNLGFKFSTSKKAWFWFNGIENQKKKTRGFYSYQQIKNTFGAVNVELQEQKFLA